MSDSVVRVGLVGAGMIAQVMHLPHLYELPDRFEVAALVRLVCPARRAPSPTSTASRIPTPTTARCSHEADVDAVLVLTGNHARPAIDAAHAGKHILVEKPMCNNLPEADELIDAAASAGIVGMVAHHKRYDPGYRLGQRAIDALESPHLVRLHDIIGPNAAFLAHYDLIRVDDVDPALMQRLRAEQAGAYRVAIGEQPAAVMQAYRFLLGLNTHDMTILHGAVGLPERVRSRPTSGTTDWPSQPYSATRESYAACSRPPRFPD